MLTIKILTGVNEYWLQSNHINIADKQRDRQIDR